MCRIRRVPRGAMASLFRQALPLAWMLFLSACGAWPTVPGPTPEARFSFSTAAEAPAAADLAAIQAFNRDPVATYQLGPGDRISVEVSDRPELSGAHVVGPDGLISLPVAGSVAVAQRSRDQAAEAVRQALGRYFLDISVIVRVDEYASNRLTVLGQVDTPGVQRFIAAPTLLEALSMAGGLVSVEQNRPPERAAVIRDQQILWVDLPQLFDGDLALNVPLRRDDIVFVPDGAESAVYVLGAVSRPGVYRLWPRMAFLDALAQAGGATLDADQGRLHLIRPGEGVNLALSMSDLLTPDPSLNLGLEDGDILYVPYSGVARVGYLLTRLNPFSNLVTIQSLTGTSGF